MKSDKDINYIKTKVSHIYSKSPDHYPVKIAQNDNLTLVNIKTPARDDNLTSKTDI